MTNIILLIGIIMFFVFALYIFEDFFSPACLVCESFLLAYISAIFSSNAGNWSFQLHFNTVGIILTGLFAFILGSIVAKGYSKKFNNVSIDINDIQQLTFGRISVYTMLAVQTIILLIYIFYYRKSVAQFSGMDWYTMIRMRRFAVSYGEGLETAMPFLVEHSVKFAKAIAYVALYGMMHNLAVKGVRKQTWAKETRIQFLVVLLYVPYSLLQSARFELMALILSGIIIWYVSYRYFSIVLHKKNRNIRKAIVKIGIVVVLVMALMSLLSTVVGRVASETLFSGAFNYFGRTIQAFDVFMNEKQVHSSIRGNETFFNVIKFLRQIGFISGEQESFHLEFTSLNGYSLGNTYTAFRRYFNDFYVFGILILPFIQGLIMSSIYSDLRLIKVRTIDRKLLFYSTIVYCLFLYSYNGYFYSTIISVNYALFFIILYLVYLLVTRRVVIAEGLKIRIKRS